MMHDFEVAIVGGGIPGLALAGTLARANVRTIVIDPAFPPASPVADDPRTAAILNANRGVLCTAGLADPFALGARLQGLRLMDRGSDNRHTLFMAQDAGMDALGCNIALAALRYALYRAMDGNPALTLLPDRVAGVACDANSVTLTLSSSTKPLRVALVVAADGRESVLHQPAGIGVTRRDLNQIAITALIAHSKPHEGISTEIHETGGPVTFVPMAGQCSALVWVDRTDLQQQRLTQSRALTIEQLQERSRAILGTLDLVGGLHGWPLMVQRVDRLIAHRTALMAEAAHVVPPTGAQGLNLSLGDAAALGDVIIQAVQDGMDPGSFALLRRYVDRRSMDIAVRTRASVSLNAVIKARGRLSQWARAGMHQICRYAPPVKRSLIRIGLGAG